MSGGILSGLLGGMIGGDQAQMGTGILGNLNGYMRDNAGTLLGFGSGMLAGDNSAAAAGALQGMQADQRTRLLKQKQAEEERQKVALQQAAQKLGIDPILAEANPDLVGTVAARKYAPRELSFEERQFNALTPDQQAVYRQRHFLGESEGWKPVSVDDGYGGKRTVFQRGSQFATPEQLGIPGGQAQAGNPYSTGGTVEENNAAMFAKRAAAADDIVLRKEGVYTNGTQKGLDYVPGVAPYLTSDEYKQAEQAKGDFIAAVLRKESGASISPEEYKRYERIFFPQPGDDAETVAQKRAASTNAVRGLMGAAGKRFQPPPGWEDPNAVRQPPKVDEKTPSASKSVSGQEASGMTANDFRMLGNGVFQHKSGAIVQKVSP